MTNTAISSPPAPEGAASRRAWRAPAGWKVAALLALVLYVPWGGTRSLWFPDEPDVAEPAMTMVESGDWIVPRRNNEPWLDYPPMTYWLGAASARLLGAPTPFAMRLPVALMAVLLAAATAAVVERLAGARAGLWGGVALVTAPHFAYQALNFHPDMAFAVFVSAGLASYAFGVSRFQGWPATAWQVAGFACFGAAILSKGPLGLLLPGLILVVWHASFRQWRSMLLLAPLSLAALAVAAPWYVLLAGETSKEFVWSEVYLQNFARFKAGARGHEQPWHYYLTRIWANWGPWSLFLPAALLTAWRRDWKRPLPRLALFWFLIMFLFLTAATTKREVYLLPAYPAIAYLVGSRISVVLGGASGRLTRWLPAAFALICLVAAVVFAILTAVGAGWLPIAVEGASAADALAFAGELLVPLTALTATCAIGAVLGLVFARRGVTELTLGMIASVLCAVYLIFGASVGPRLEPKRTYRPGTEALRELSGARPIGYYLPGADLKLAGFRVNDPLFLPLETFESPREVALYLREPGNVVVLIAGRAGEIAPAIPDWENLAKRELILGSRAFLALGPRLEPPSPVD